MQHQVNIRLTSTAKRTAIEAQGRLQRKDVISEVESDTTGPGIKEHHGICAGTKRTP